MIIRMYGIPNCDTVKRARSWFAGQGVDVGFHDFKKSGVPAGDLRAWMVALGRESLVNRKGTTWRKLDPAQQALADQDATALTLLQHQPSLIKRPVVQWPNGRLTVGFDAVKWAGFLSAGPG